MRTATISLYSRENQRSCERGLSVPSHAFAFDVGNRVQGVRISSTRVDRALDSDHLFIPQVQADAVCLHLHCQHELVEQDRVHHPEQADARRKVEAHEEDPNQPIHVRRIAAAVDNSFIA